MSLKKLASLIVKISANGAQAQAEFRKLEKSAQDFGKSMRNIGTNMTKYVTAPLVALGAVSVKVANTQLQAEAKLLNALKGREDVQKRLMEQASKIQSRTLFGDEAIIEQQAYLAALGLSEQQINDTIEAAVQLSAALGMDLTSAVKNLAKTYGGMTGELGESIPALKNFTQEQLKAGEAIGYVNANYKGFAEAAASTGTGSLTQLQNKLGDLAEKIGIILIPVLEDLVVVLGYIVDILGKLPEPMQKVVVGVGAVGAAIGPLLTGLSSAITLASSFTTSVTGLTTSITGLLSAITTAAGPLAAFAGWFGAAAWQFQGWAGQINSDRDRARQAEYEKAKAIYMDEIIDQATAADALQRAKQQYEAEKAEWEAHGSKKVGYYNPMAMLLAWERWRGISDAYKERFMTQGSTAPIAASDVADTNAELQEELGIIERLEKELSELYQLRDKAKDLAELDKVNQRIKIVSAELNSLRNFDAKEYFLQIEYGQTIPTTDLKFAVGGPKAASLEGLGVTNQALQEWKETQRARFEQMAATIGELNAILTESIHGAFIAVGEELGDLITGEEFTPLQRLLELLGKMLKELGTALITYVGLIEAFKGAFANPITAIAVGVAAVAAGQAFMNLAKKPIKLAQGGLAYGPTMAVVGDNPGAANDPEVVAPLSKLRDYMGGQKLELTGDIQWELRGDTLRAVLDRNNIRVATLG